MIKKAYVTVTDCEECPRFHEPTFRCLADKEQREAGENEIPDWCPLETVGGAENNSASLPGYAVGSLGERAGLKNVGAETERDGGWFREQMLKAYKHGLEFEYFGGDKDFSTDTTADKYLPFAEWFYKYYGQHF